MHCEIEHCGRAATATENGIRLCTRCYRRIVPVGAGIVRIDGQWRGVCGATYTATQRMLFDL